MEEENITVPQNQIEMHQETGLFDLICFHATHKTQICGTVYPVLLYTNFTLKLDSTWLIDVP